MLEKVFASSGDVLVGSEFNLPMINTLWQIVAGARCASTFIISSILNLSNQGWMMETQGK